MVEKTSKYPDIRKRTCLFNFVYFAGVKPFLALYNISFDIEAEDVCLAGFALEKNFFNTC